ncbi:hypothetical protein [uncultured Tateyamaria sp.]|uniref:hypothetical protein n=1 Tax=uncultured Tateyamaria sp. TaxID=455651 RepID=UPI00260E926D|nr:hypothetical protein [uncultured Tateyamaria sp.]
MARDNRIERAKRAPKPAQTQRVFTTSDRVQLLVSDILSDVSRRIEEKRTQDSKGKSS